MVNVKILTLSQPVDGQTEYKVSHNVPGTSVFAAGI